MVNLPSVFLVAALQQSKASVSKNVITDKFLLDAVNKGVNVSCFFSCLSVFSDNLLCGVAVNDLKMDIMWDLQPPSTAHDWTNKRETAAIGINNREYPPNCGP